MKFFKVQNGNHVDLHIRVTPTSEEPRELTVACNLSEEYADILAATPEMLEVLRGWIGCYSLDGTVQVPDDIIKQLVAQARAAIKATGKGE